MIGSLNNCIPNFGTLPLLFVGILGVFPNSALAQDKLLKEANIKLDSEILRMEQRMDRALREGPEAKDSLDAIRSGLRCAFLPNVYSSSEQQRKRCQEIQKRACVLVGR